MKILALYVITAVTFFVIDAIGLRLMIKPVFERHVAHPFHAHFEKTLLGIFPLEGRALATTSQIFEKGDQSTASR